MPAKEAPPPHGMAGSKDAPLLVVCATPPRFSAGDLCITPGALDAVPAMEIAAGLARHLQADWGTIYPEDKAMNEAALASKDRLLSQYSTVSGNVFWVITDPGHQTTTVLLPAEY